jgi:hypothetical protein
MQAVVQVELQEQPEESVEPAAVETVEVLEVAPLMELLTQAAAAVVAAKERLAVSWLVLTAALASSSFVTPTHTLPQRLLRDHRQSPSLAVIAYTSGLAPARLRFKESSWRISHNLMKTMSLRK